MAKNKKRGGGPKFRGQRFPNRKDGSSGNHFGEYGGNTSSPAPQGFIRAHGYTLADEARNTASNRRGAFGRDARLRYKPVTFVSAGLMDPLKDLDVRLATTDKAQENEGDANEFPDVGIVSASPDDEPPHDHQSTHRTGLSSGPDHGHSSDSSEDVVLFKGRDRTRSRRDDANSDSLKLRELDLELRAVEETLHEDAAPADTMKKASIEADGFISLSSKSGGRKRGNRRGQGTSSDEDAAAVIADYMANIKSWAGENDDDDDVEHPGLGSHSFNVLRDLGGTDSDAIPDEFSGKDNTDCVSEDGTDAASQVHGFETEDERMARLLAKQEELGLGGDDVLLFDGDASTDEWLTPTKTNSRRKRKGDSKSAKIFQKKGQYPSATQMADAFDELDLMDWHRPSLNNFKKSPQAFDVSDSELEEAMNTTWQKDRLKKAEKKKAREELRSRGLLGKKANPDDLRVKYLGGMSLDDLANELETFLLSSQEQLILPPFDKGTRKTIHMIANKFKIKSQSAGKGQDRYPVLYRSKATLPFDQNTFDRTFGRIKQTWFPRVDADEKIVNESRLLKRSEARNGKSRFKNSLSYRDGEIVGQNAAELGAENRGRAMLEKMGWSKGMALGTGENKGIMVPITHVVKKTKAGLGDN
ncbi:hypothetical protein F4806DRAFT_477436 [Annulohypoxylon nitens]|nr:hypothetical protein F4806DRAFT_477436 [Annulohypoxylon nitens]